MRSLSRRLGLRTADKPAAACLASRIPYGTPVTLGVLGQVGRAEGACDGSASPRSGCGTTASSPGSRFPFASLGAVLEAREKVVGAVHAAGYRYVTLDLEGLRSGNLNGSSAPPPRASLRAPVALAAPGSHGRRRTLRRRAVTAVKNPRCPRKSRPPPAFYSSDRRPLLVRPWAPPLPAARRSTCRSGQAGRSHEAGAGLSVRRHRRAAARRCRRRRRGGHGRGRRDRPSEARAAVGAGCGKTSDLRRSSTSARSRRARRGGVPARSRSVASLGGGRAGIEDLPAGARGPPRLVEEAAFRAGERQDFVGTEPAALQAVLRPHRSHHVVPAVFPYGHASMIPCFRPTVGGGPRGNRTGSRASTTLQRAGRRDYMDKVAAGRFRLIERLVSVLEQLSHRQPRLGRPARHSAAHRHQLGCLSAGHHEVSPCR